MIHHLNSNCILRTVGTKLVPQNFDSELAISDLERDDSADVGDGGSLNEVD